MLKCSNGASHMTTHESDAKVELTENGRLEMKEIG